MDYIWAWISRRVHDFIHSSLWSSSLVSNNSSANHSQSGLDVMVFVCMGTCLSRMAVKLDSYDRDTADRLFELDISKSGECETSLRNLLVSIFLIFVKVMVFLDHCGLGRAPVKWMARWSERPKSLIVSFGSTWSTAQVKTRLRVWPALWVNPTVFWMRLSESRLPKKLQVRASVGLSMWMLPGKIRTSSGNSRNCFKKIAGVCLFLLDGGGQ